MCENIHRELFQPFAMQHNATIYPRHVNGEIVELDQSNRLISNTIPLTIHS